MSGVEEARETPWVAKLKVFTLRSSHSPGWLTPRWDVDRMNEEVGWGRPLCAHRGDLSGCELASEGISS